MTNSVHEIVVSKLVYGVSSKNQCENTLKFIQFFDDNKTKKDRPIKSDLDCFMHDPVSKFTQTEKDPFYICGVMMGVSYTGLCHIDEKVLNTAKNLFNDSLNEYNTYMQKSTDSTPLTLNPTLILFGEGITKWETN